MCLARPCTTASVTLTSGCSDVPDFSAYLRAYAHILSTLAFEGSAIGLSPQRRGERAPCRPSEGADAPSDSPARHPHPVGGGFRWWALVMFRRGPRRSP